MSTIKHSQIIKLKCITKSYTITWPWRQACFHLNDDFSQSLEHRYLALWFWFRFFSEKCFEHCCGHVSRWWDMLIVVEKFWSFEQLVYYTVHGNHILELIIMRGFFPDLDRILLSLYFSKVSLWWIYTWREIQTHREICMIFCHYLTNMWEQFDKNIFDLTNYLYKNSSGGRTTSLYNCNYHELCAIATLCAKIYFHKIFTINNTVTHLT